ncbi:MAG: hypothetical protein GF418_12405 [Chitinivibrionales bacterium]|nr:hypothetical protein [Chitinivibrionales bacterium]MBD3396421.1 hypothetical protein [Chitinivibrionales bacterium]
MRSTHLKLLTLACALAAPAGAVDGIAVSYHSRSTNSYGHHTGMIVRHIIRDSAVALRDTIYDSSDARAVRISPDGTRVAFVRVSDGMLCTMPIESGGVSGLAEIGINACVDWGDTSWIYYSRMYNHVTVRRIHAGTGEVEDYGYFPVGAATFSISSGRDSLRGIAVLDNGGGAYEASTFDYRVFLVATYTVCAGYMSPTGAYHAVDACEDDTAGYHARRRIYTWEGALDTTLVAPEGEFLSRGGWSANADSWMVASVGAGPELLEYHDMVLFTRDGSAAIRITANDSGSYDEACDFWLGDPDSALAKSARLRDNTAMPANHRAGPGVTRKTPRAPRNAAVCIYAPNGALISSVRWGASRRKLPAARLSPGVYVVRDGGGTCLRRVVGQRRP